MNRRLFLTQIATSISVLFVGKTLAGQTLAKPPHSSHNDQHMDHGPHNDMMSNSGSQMAHMVDHNSLLPTSALPSGLPLPQLNYLTNESQQLGEFIAHLTAKVVTLPLSEQVQTEFWSYNGQIPGPAIEVYEGDKVTIIVKNELPQATTIHWHGLPVPPEQDGNPQDEVKPGESKSYTFTLPSDCAGTYWYHPHGHGTVAEQVFRGLAGVFIVKSKQDPLAHLQQQNWLISDLRLAKNGSIPQNTMMDWMNGREGQFVLINGFYQPLITLSTATRVRVWNACSARYLNLALTNCDIYLVGTDGGLIEQPQLIDKIFLSPGERAELVIIPKESATSTLVNIAYDRKKMGRGIVETDLLLATVITSASEMPKLPHPLRTLPSFGEHTEVKTLEYTEVMNRGMHFLINGKKHDMARIDLTSKVGEVELWHIFNNSHMDHNFHIHGTQFEVIKFELNGQISTPSFRSLKDTVNLKPYEKVTIKIVQHHKGLRMYHCHILEHETLGMMGQLAVI